VGRIVPLRIAGRDGARLTA